MALSSEHPSQPLSASLSTESNSVPWRCFAVCRHEEQIGHSVGCDDKVCQSPWFIAYDIYADAIVISIRGSKTTKDVATDCKTRGSYRSEFSIEPALLHYSDKGQTKTILAHRVCVHSPIQHRESPLQHPTSTTHYATTMSSMYCSITLITMEF